MSSISSVRRYLIAIVLALVALNVFSIVTRPMDEFVDAPNQSGDTVLSVPRIDPASETDDSFAYKAQRFLRRLDPGNDSWRPMRMAKAYADANGSDRLYDVFFEERVKFQYPPSSLLLLELFEVIFGPDGPGDGVLNFLSLFFFLATVVLIWLTYVVSMGRALGPTARLSLIDHALFVALALVAYPTLKSLALGQIQTWLNAAFSGAVLLFVLDRKAWAGVVLGLICTMKPQLGLFLIWALVRREHGFTVGMVATLAVCELTALATYGWAAHFAYLDVLSFLSRHGESYYLNQSLNGFLLRLLGIGPNLSNGSGGWIGGSSFPPHHFGVYLATTVTSLLLTVWALWPRRGHAGESRSLDFCIAAICFTIASPIAWIHHYGVVPIAYAVAIPLLVTPPQRRLAIGLFVCWVAIAVPFPVTKLLATTPFGFLQSHAFFGGLGLIAGLEALRRRAASRDGAPEAPAS